MKWIKGGNMSDIYQMAEIYDGNFSKFILRLKNLVTSYIGMLEINADMSVIQFKDFEKLLVKDITIPDSLYLSL